MEFSSANIWHIHRFVEWFSEVENHIRVVCTSGGYDPLHFGHLSCFQESKNYGNVLVALVNGDGFLKRKKGKPFLDLFTRCEIVAALKPVDIVIPLTGEYDQDTVDRALAEIRPNVFTKGGDRCDARTIPEWETCKRLGIEIQTGVGASKKWSSSNFLKDWEDFKCL